MKLPLFNANPLSIPVWVDQFIRSTQTGIPMAKT